MSDNPDALNKAIQDKIGVDRLALQKKQTKIWEYEISNKFDDIEKRKEDLVINASIDPTKANPDRIKRIQQNSEEYLLAAQNAKVFLYDDFAGKVPYFQKNLILLAAETGQGKSTVSANLAFHALTQGQKVLVITNEEDPADVYNRVSCLIKGWSYTKHENFTRDQIDFFNSNIETLSQRMVVVDDGYSNRTGQTTTIEGMEAIFNALHTKQHDYDVIIIDYYQNVSISTKDPKKVDWQVQDLFVKLLDSVKNYIRAPIILLAQKKRAKKDEEVYYKELVEGRKSISNAATCVVEISTDKSMCKTSFRVAKSRFAEAVGETIAVGFDKGKYIPWTSEFQTQALLRKERIEHSKVLKQSMNGEGKKNEENK